MRAASWSYFRLLKSHKVQKYVRLDRKTRQQMNMVCLWLLLLLWACPESWTMGLTENEWEDVRGT